MERFTILVLVFGCGFSIKYIRINRCEESMRLTRLIPVILAVLAALVSCSRDPNVVKKRYFESANKYFDKGQYKQASIQYRNALKQDPKYAAAHYKLALTFLKTGDITGAHNAFRRAMELLPKDSPDRIDSIVKLSE